MKVDRHTPQSQKTPDATNNKPTRVRPPSEDDRPTYYIASCRRQRSLQASGDPSHLRGRPHRLVTPIDHGTPKEAVRFKSMTLKEAYSVPKHTSAICVQSFDDSLNSAIHITYRISLRSSSLREPRYPLLRVLDRFDFASSRVSNDTNITPTHTNASSHNRAQTKEFGC